MKPSFSSTALLIVDVQETLPILVQQHLLLLKRCCFAVEAATLLKLPIFITEQSPEKLGKTHSQLTLLAGQAPVFPKTKFSAFGAVSLKEALQKNNIHTLLVLGVETGICIYQTVIDALDAQYKVVLLTDCVACSREEDGKVTINFFSTKTDACLLPSETIFYNFIEDAAEKHFRAFNQLVKKYR